MEFDSDEEMYFSWWLQELQEKGFIKSFNRAKSYELGHPVIYEWTERKNNIDLFNDSTILDGSIYTPDFEIVWEDKAINIFVNPNITNIIKQPRTVRVFTEKSNEPINKKLFIQINGVSIIEVKPDFDLNNMTRLNTIDRKWLFQSRGIFTNLVLMPSFFKKTFTPNRFLLTNKTNKVRALKYQPITLEEYINKLNNKK